MWSDSRKDSCPIALLWEWCLLKQPFRLWRNHSKTAKEEEERSSSSPAIEQKRSRSDTYQLLALSWSLLNSVITSKQFTEDCAVSYFPISPHPNLLVFGWSEASAKQMEQSSYWGKCNRSWKEIESWAIFHHQSCWIVVITVYRNSLHNRYAPCACS